MLQSLQSQENAIEKRVIDLIHCFNLKNNVGSNPKHISSNLLSSVMSKYHNLLLESIKQSEEMSQNIDARADIKTDPLPTMRSTQI